MSMVCRLAAVNARPEGGSEVLLLGKVLYSREVRRFLARLWAFIIYAGGGGCE